MGLVPVPKNPYGSLSIVGGTLPPIRADRGAILFRDDFRGGTLSKEWTFWRMRFGVDAERNELRALPEVAPGYDYGHHAQGRCAEAVLHIGDSSWRDYELRYRVSLNGSGLKGHAFPRGFRGLQAWFRMEQGFDDWNRAPGLTAYHFGFHTDGVGQMPWQAGLYAARDSYVRGRGWSPDTSGWVGEVAVERLAPSDDTVYDVVIACVGPRIQIRVSDAGATDAPTRIVVDTLHTDARAPRYGGVGLGFGWETLGAISDVVVTELNAGR